MANRKKEIEVLLKHKLHEAHRVSTTLTEEQIDGDYLGHLVAKSQHLVELSSEIDDYLIELDQL